MTSDPERPPATGVRAFLRWLLGPPACRECGLLQCEADDVECCKPQCHWRAW